MQTLSDLRLEIKKCNSLLVYSVKNIREIEERESKTLRDESRLENLTNFIDNKLRRRDRLGQRIDLYLSDIYGQC